MKYKFLAVAAVLAFFVVGPASVASAGEGLYLSVHAGGPVPKSQDTRLRGAACCVLVNNGKTSYDFGLGGGGAVGYTFPQAHRLGGFRIEAEFDYFYVTPSHRHQSFGRFHVGGSVDQYSFLANVYYDFDEFKDMLPLPVTPYVGFGLGASIVSANEVTLPGFGSFTDSDTVFAFQVIGGLAYKIMPNLVLGGEYRYIRTADPKFQDSPAGGGGVQRLISNNDRHMFGLSLRYYLNWM